MMLPPRQILALHRAITAIPSVSGDESAVAGYLADFLSKRVRRHGARVERIGNSVLARMGTGPILLLDTHVDTVPAVPGWTRDPWTVEGGDGRIRGLGANDAKAAVAAMTAAFLAWLDVELPFTLALALVEGEETRGTGTQAVLAALAERGEMVEAAVVGEPTGLDIAVAQKGLMVLELRTRGEACHAAHAAALGAANAARRLARDLVALEGIDFGPPHPHLGPITLEPTQLQAGTARNVVPAEATAILDVRTTPDLSRDEIVRRVRAAVEGEVRVLSDRLRPKATPPDALVVEAARHARPEACLFGSATLSDMVFLNGTPAIKCGPGKTERSHTPDEYVLESEILDGARFYTRLIGAYAEKRALTPRPPLPSHTPAAGRGDGGGGGRGGAIP